MALFLCLPFLIAKIFFAWSLYKTYTLIPVKYTPFPAWMSWLILIPVVGYIFEWILLPFGLPFALERYQPDNQPLQHIRRRLFGLGLAYCIIMLMAIPTFGLTLLINLVLLIIYWINVVEVRSLLSGPQSNHSHNRKA